MPTSLITGIRARRSPLVGSDVMIQRVQDFDWGETAAGPIDAWPEDLRAVCRTTLLSSMPMAVLIGRDGIVLANDALREVFGADYDHLLGKPVGEGLIHSGEFAVTMLDQAFHGQSTRFEDIPLPLSEAGGSRQAWFDLDFTPVVNGQGSVLGALVVIIDTTQRKRALLDLEHSRERLDLALASGGVVGVWEVDFDTESVRSDERYARLHGVDPEVAALGAPAADFIAGIHPEDLDHVMASFDMAKRDGEYRCQHRVVGWEGERWIVASGRVKRDDQGAPKTFTGTAVDVTDQVEAAIALSESEKRFRTYAEALPHIVFGWEPCGRITYANRRWQAFTGRDEGDPKFWDWSDAIHPDERPLVLADWKDACASQQPLTFEARYRRHCGEYRWMRSVALPIHDDAGTLGGWIGTLTDIHEERLAAAERELVASELDHRIKNFFALAHGLVNLTAREAEDVRSFAEQLQGRLVALHRSHDLIRQAGGARSPQGGEALHALFHRLVEPYEMAIAQTRVVIEGDDLALSQAEATPFALVLHELATNAAKYGALGVPQGRLRIVSRHQDGRLIILWEETGVTASAEVTGGGFGSRLITLIVESQMKGRFERRVQPHGVTIRIDVPRP